MDVKQEEMQFLGVFGIFRKACKLIYTWRRIFAQISLALILPLSFLLLAYMEISNIFLGKIIHNDNVLNHTHRTTPKFQKLSDIVSSEIIYYLLFNFAYIFLSVIFSLLATSAVVYTVACIYTAREVTFKQVMSVVPKVWKRLFVTVLCVSAALFAFNFVVLFIFSLIIAVIVLKYGPYGFGSGVIMINSLFLLFYIAALWYLVIIWQLSSVVSVLEDSRGFKAMAKSKALIKGKMTMARNTLILLSFPLGTTQLVFRYLVVQSTSSGVAVKGVLGIVCLLSFALFFLFHLVAETVLYFVCKSYHHENIDKSALSDRLQVYLPGGYVPLNAEGVEFEKLQIV